MEADELRRWGATRGPAAAGGGGLYALIPDSAGTSATCLDGGSSAASPARPVRGRKVMTNLRRHQAGAMRGGGSWASVPLLPFASLAATQMVKTLESAT